MILTEITQQCAAEGFTISSLSITFSATPTSGAAATTASGAAVPVGSANSNPSVGFSSGGVQQGSSPTPTSGSGSGGSNSGALSINSGSFMWTVAVAGAVGGAAMVLGL